MNSVIRTWAGEENVVKKIINSPARRAGAVLQFKHVMSSSLK
jgi:hypothetical protein